MFHALQETHVESLKRHLNAWKKDSGMSEMTMFDLIVAAHIRIGGPEKTGIHFSDGKDEYNRQKANQIRIKRLLAESEEGIGREQADQLVNVLPSILAAMPANLRISYLNEYLAPLDMHASSNEESEDGEVTVRDLAEVMHTDAQKHQLLAQLIEGADAETLQSALNALNASIAATKKRSRIIQGLIRTGKFLGKFTKLPKRNQLVKETV